jgi:Tol biopolymer transport system component
VTNDPAEDVAPAFSADGTRIAFASNRDGHWQIYSMRRDGSDPARLVTSASNDTDPAFSADGSVSPYLLREAQARLRQL